MNEGHVTPGNAASRELAQNCKVVEGFFQFLLFLEMEKLSEAWQTVDNEFSIFLGFERSRVRRWNKSKTRSGYVRSDRDSDDSVLLGAHKYPANCSPLNKSHRGNVGLELVRICHACNDLLVQPIAPRLGVWSRLKYNWLFINFYFLHFIKWWNNYSYSRKQLGDKYFITRAKS